MAYFKTGANDYSSLQYTNFTNNNIKSGVTISVKDPNGNTLNSVTGTYTPPTPTHTYRVKTVISDDNITYNMYVDGVLKSSETQSLYQNYDKTITV